MINIIAFISFFIMSFFMGIAGGFINKDKGYSFWGGFGCCFLLSIIGLVIVICQKPKDTININVSNADELHKYKVLLDSGAISEEEYKTIKEKLLKNI